MYSLIPEPKPDERPTNYANRVGQWYSSITPPEHKKQYGQYFTSAQVADFMAHLCGNSVQKETVRILDPGAGAGILTCAICEYLTTRQAQPRKLIVEAYESDGNLLLALRKVLSYLQNNLKSQGVSLISVLSTEDFVVKYGNALHASSFLPLIQAPLSSFDLVISNPPYFKIPKSDPRAKAAAAVVHGQPNIYALFMAVAASVLTPEGVLIFITPRSFASGLYFRRFRKYFFTKLKPEAIHLFTSRRDTFKHDRVLQENIVLKARRLDGWTSQQNASQILISSSQGVDDLSLNSSRSAPLEFVLDISSANAMLHIPASKEEEHIVRLIRSWSGSLKTYGLEISTGPVVPFRAASLLSERGNLKTHAPLLWMQSVHMMSIKWPADLRKKPQYIRSTESAKPLLLPNTNYVLIRRVSAKEDSRRLVAAPFLAGSLSTSLIGLENHLNYIHRPRGTLSEDEAWGLATLYNSSLFDTYFRTLNGNTQVSATELRSIPLPDLETIIEIGCQARKSVRPEQEVENLISSAFDLML